MCVDMVVRLWCVRCVVVVVCVHVVLCVMLVVCGVVWCGLACGNLFVCRFKTPPCVRSSRLRVYRENARMC